MNTTEKLQPHGEKIRKTVRWICETLRYYPERDRMSVIREAQVRFDLSPLEARFITEKLGSEALEEEGEG